ncbi:unnamed protein product [Phytophthora fragariaefolia]|uniref:Unnamed protein product n=1 Tax=Phytophthora fragariaefolia TaxID=1490495 RepID=A0A9W6Y785_9STRA|nr:unnamed protein product [Phytophthora fragariaefolia]
MLNAVSTPRVKSLKLHVNSYVRRDGEPLIRWLVEVDTAITARRIVDPLSKVAFAMPCLGGRARSWAYGRRLTDPMCFSTYEVLKEELRLAFEPPQNGFKSRATFLDLQQVKHDVHDDTQIPRYLVSNIVTNPIDEATKVVTFMKGLEDGHTAALSESRSHYKKRDGKLNLVILNVNSKRERSLRALVDCGASNNFFRLGSLGRLDFEEVELPRSLLKVRLATGVTVRTEKRVVSVPFSYPDKKFVDELIVLDLDDKFDMVLGMS